jgi:hypothetical protein
MSLPIGSYAVGKHGFFFRDGDTITIPASGSSAGASSRTNKPDPTDPLYLDVGAIADWDDSGFKSMGDEKIYKPMPGRMQLYDIIEKGAEGMFKFTTEDISALAMEVFFRTSQKLTSAGGVYNPLSAPPRKGWFHMEHYDQNNAFMLNLDVYVMLRIVGGMASKEGSVIKPQWEANVLYSSFNVGLINNS